MSTNDDVTAPEPTPEPQPRWTVPAGTPAAPDQGSPEGAVEASRGSVPGAGASVSAGKTPEAAAATQQLSVTPPRSDLPTRQTGTSQVPGRAQETAAERQTGAPFSERTGSQMSSQPGTGPQDETRPLGHAYTGVPQAPQGYRFMPPTQQPPHQQAQPASHQQAQVHAQAASQQQGQPAAGYSALGASAAGAASASVQGAGGAQPPFTPYDRSQSSTPPAGSGTSGERRRGPGWGGVVAATLAAALLASGGTAAGTRYLEAQSTSGTSVTSQPAAVATGSTTKTVSSTGTAPDWEAVTAAVSNSVVAITVATDQGSAVGSGVVYDSSGHIMTNNHVISGATQIQVTLADGRIYEAELTGTDPATDLAVIQLKNAPSDLTVAQLGDSEALVTGQDVMAIGNPLGLSSTATTGIVSALNRPVVTTQEESSEDSQSQASASQVCTNAIQIDAAVNPGNSGGPLFDETGKVVGITSSIASMSSSSGESGSIGIGFAIPVNLAKKVADQLIATGTATHAYLGVSIGDGGGEADGVTRAGAQIGTVESGSPAQKAGIVKGDVVTAIDGKATTQAAALTGFVRQYLAGDTVTLTVIRDGKEQEVQVTLEERKDS